MSRAGTEVTFRPFQSQDQDAVRELILGGLGDHFPVVDASLNPDLEDISASYIEEGHFFLVAQLAGQIVGVGGLITVDDDVGRLVRISVARECRRLGIGAMIVNRLVEIARKRQYGRLVVETNHDWHEAIGLYQRCGFEPYDHDEISLHMDLRLESAP